MVLHEIFLERSSYDSKKIHELDGFFLLVSIRDTFTVVRLDV